MYSLLIDSSNQPLAVALMKEDQVLGTYTSAVKQNHSVQLMPQVAALLETAKITPQDLTDIIVAQGPGSYTGLRIGVTVAKTLAYTLNANLYGVSSLKALAATLQWTDRVIVPIMNARREHVYAGAYQWQDGQLNTVMEDQYIALTDLIERMKDEQKVLFIGEDVRQFEESLQDFDVLLLLPKAEAMWQHKGEPQNVHSFSPQYLKLSEAEQNWLNQQNSKTN
ncbi:MULTISPECIES: tRNA (adenosine(37)-N6)-threonylcarbamoyltransferase complex dimerization subunit type 1 TsaB [unclassified Staphylococcus]|uniref:tRNA (adenosine(37)-N6)-threonylcarbamoyltransferase complex dimerization subunit type 1 TsaB n=1 Tax=unclassified Staphylococcus TaxID=91994 RepID=UPI0021D330A4|nr:MULTISPECIES: tRNA (adenosine(37)-N6)-threonylcarbamoyltransferase complex dimerization subunit type 1 TsaB [unclassified Staphylococcus]UXR69096.1 tRNA (adenosine(37)-N6)-threonylcarbamoyltransferase complex dimerization subunit type 1 TsaB [Staphylococcus sp. IVB6246]UXR71147.1 tRNA (adenosine(37)-N6)-threonylcarbamoyltransferase complex dimerization subunit type 1 TsaB [Staphylococcus sp. IVB6240]UXR73422.1 tRNA (adenosine(37)-N6)-threonylcarbamoyltransferase complex dimerization subunit t